MSLLFPKKVKYRKEQTKRKPAGRVQPASRGTSLSFGSYGLKALTAARVTSNQIESARKVISRHAGKSAKTWIRIFPDRPFTAKGAEVPMGKGKGDVEGYKYHVEPGRVIFEVDGVSSKVARDALNQAAYKLPLKTRVISRE